MGCDIHFYVEELRDGKWVSADMWTKDKYEPSEIVLSEELYGDRNYNLFAILANVRNGYGFAGVKTGEGFVPICEPRGVPEDASDEVKAECRKWDGDGHSHSWLTVREILDYDWNRKTMLGGWVDVENWRAWKNFGSPRAWSGDVFGGGIRKVTEPEMAAIVENAETEQELDGLKCYVQWERYYHECMGSFSKTIVRALHRASPEKVRFVFWFDN